MEGGKVSVEGAVPFGPVEERCVAMSLLNW